MLAYDGGMAFERIPANPERMGGVPCIRDLRVTVSMVLGQLAGGRTMEQLLIDYPYLEREDVLAALEYAAAVVDQRELRLARPASDCSSTPTSRPASPDNIRAAGHEAVHVIDLNIATATDTEIVERAEADGYITVTATPTSPHWSRSDDRPARRS